MIEAEWWKDEDILKKAGLTKEDLAEIVKTGDLGNPYRFLGLRTKEGK